MPYWFADEGRQTIITHYDESCFSRTGDSCEQALSAGTAIGEAEETLPLRLVRGEVDAQTESESHERSRQRPPDLYPRNRNANNAAVNAESWAWRSPFRDVATVSCLKDGQLDAKGDVTFSPPAPPRGLGLANLPMKELKTRLREAAGGWWTLLTLS